MKKSQWKFKIDAHKEEKKVTLILRDIMNSMQIKGGRDEAQSLNLLPEDKRKERIWQKKLLRKAELSWLKIFFLAYHKTD